MKKRQYRQSQRNSPDELSYRYAPASGGFVPSSVNAETRTVDYVAATESPVPVLDYERWEVVPEILLMRGARIPKSRQIPLLDSHSRWSSTSVIGSARDLSIVGSELRATAHFASTGPARTIFPLVAEGHLSDVSVGYRVNKSVFIPAGQSQTVEGRTYEGPVKVVTDWSPKELSTTPIGADELAKARSDRPQPRKEGPNTMEKWLKDFLVSRGLSATATDEEARAFLQTLDVKSTVAPSAVPDPVAPAVNTDELRSTAAAEERTRVLAIGSMCREFKCDDLAQVLIDGGSDIHAARAAVMDRIKATVSDPQAGFRPTSVEPGVDERDKFRAAANDSILVRLGIHPNVQQAAPGATELSVFSMRELARECLRIANQPVGGNVLEMVGRAMMTSDLPYVLAAGANKVMLRGWEAQPSTYQTWCDIGSASDFKTFNLVNLSEASNLDTVPEGAKYNYGEVVDSREQAYLTTYGKIFAVTRQAVINDDLNAMMRLPEAYGRSAKRKVNALAYAVLTGNPTMGDGHALFYARTYTNIMSSAAVSDTSMAEGIKLMKLQRDASGLQPLNIEPKYIIAPVTIEGVVRSYLASPVWVGVSSSTKQPATNIYAGRFEPVFDPLLDASSASHWYMAAEKGMTVTVFFLQGQTEPYMEQQTGWTVDGTEIKVRIDAAAKAVDWRGLLYNAV